MRFGFSLSDSESMRGAGSSFRRSRAGISPDRGSCVSTTSKSIPCSKRASDGLREYSKMIVDVETFSSCIEDWVLQKLPSNSCDKKLLFKPPFMVDELQKLDYALDGVFFQQLFRMPYSHHGYDNSREEKFLALVCFLQTIVDGLWRTFWHKTGEPPFFVSCPRYPGSRFYTIEQAVSNGRLGGLCGAAVVAKVDSDSHVRWNDVLELALFKSDITDGKSKAFSMLSICEALFYGFHILLLRNLSKSGASKGSSIYMLVLDSKFGGIIKFGGDLSRLDVNSCNPYHAVVEWIKNHAEVSVSPIDRVWNKLGNANWGDVGTLQLLLATYYSIIQWKGPPRKSIAHLATDQSLLIQKRRLQCYGLSAQIQNGHNGQWETIELDHQSDQTPNKLSMRPNLKEGEVIRLEDSQGQVKFQIKDIILVGDSLSYSAFTLDQPCKLFTLYVGVHPSRLEPSWEAMSLWYLVQRQTKILNIMKQQGVSSKNLPELILSGRVLHSGHCSKQNPGDCCEHPWCGTPVLVTSPVGEPVSHIIARYGSFCTEEALRFCRDILTSLKSATSANIQHGDICPENIVRVISLNGRTESLYIAVSWGRAVLEDRDSPAMNLQFSSVYALQHRKLCPSSDTESLIYLLYFVCGGEMQQQDSIESALRWRERCWAKRMIQHQLGEVSTLLKAFADYVDSLCGTPYPVDYDIWLRRLNRVVACSDKGKCVERLETSLRFEDVAETSGTSGGCSSFTY
ncbi:Calcium/calmodulin-dependent protein kinase protein [Dioscorea alata]|uniref:Calcium/calmodulin-dependent protein kinase protein n=1 Tax=Dioscorea alata TaxID=55571 RepID=A0ACB7WC58_DIOAL|nr:Calcium/calmodulin-dependent protein kinase protein [Dioscorea alata]